MARKAKEIVTPELDLWVENKGETETTVEVIPKKKRSGAYSKQKGNAYERQIVKELKEITGDLELATSRAESKKLDDQKIDIFDPNNVLPFYVQCKSTQVTPSIKKINSEVGKVDKSLAIFWNAQEKKAVNICSVGEYVIVTKALFYDMLKNYFNEQESN